MHSIKAKSPFQRQLRQFRVVVMTDPEVVYSSGKETLLAFDVEAIKNQVYEVKYDVYIDLAFFEKRLELFRAGHRLVLKAWTDNFSPLLYAIDARFDRRPE